MRKGRSRAFQTFFRPLRPTSHRDVSAFMKVVVCRHLSPQISLPATNARKMFFFAVRYIIQFESFDDYLETIACDK